MRGKVFIPTKDKLVSLGQKMEEPSISRGFMLKTHERAGSG
jgi:hypothetical protein